MYNKEKYSRIQKNKVMKCKTFREYDEDSFDMVVNKWLGENQGIVITHIISHGRNTNGGYVMTSIFYIETTEFIKIDK